MIKGLEDAIEKVKTLPEERQRIEIARVIHGAQAEDLGRSFIM